MQEEIKQYQKRPEASQIFKDTHLLASETLRPCARSHGVDTQVVALEKRPCKDMAILATMNTWRVLHSNFNSFKSVPRLSQALDILDCQLLEHSNTVPAAMGSMIYFQLTIQIHLYGPIPLGPLKPSEPVQEETKHYQKHPEASQIFRYIH